MIYKKFQDKELSALGMGCMRFPTMEGDPSKIDEPQKAYEAILEKTKEL